MPLHVAVRHVRCALQRRRRAPVCVQRAAYGEQGGSAAGGGPGTSALTTQARLFATWPRVARGPPARLGSAHRHACLNAACNAGDALTASNLAHAMASVRARGHCSSHAPSAPRTGGDAHMGPSPAVQPSPVLHFLQYCAVQPSSAVHCLLPEVGHEAHKAQEACGVGGRLVPTEVVDLWSVGWRLGGIAGRWLSSWLAGTHTHASQCVPRHFPNIQLRAPARQARPGQARISTREQTAREGGGHMVDDMHVARAARTSESSE